MLSFLRGGKQSAETLKMAAQMVQKEIESNKVVVFSKTYCPYCTQAKQALDAELGRGKYKVIEIENRSDTAEIQQYLQKITGARTVPRVFIGGKCIGGGTETARMRAAGELRRLLAELGLL